MVYCFVPNELKCNSRAVKLPEAVLPHCESVVSEFVASGGQLTLQSQRRDLMLEHDRAFQLQYPKGYSPILLYFMQCLIVIA